MAKEFETRVLNVDREEIKKKLEALGAKLVKEVLMKRITFDYPDRRLDAKHAFIRVRDDGQGKIQLAYKWNKRADEHGVGDTEEIEFEIPDMDLAKQFFLAIGLEYKQYIETKRTEYALGDLRFDIDEWPMMPPFLEVEGPSAERVMEGVTKLGFTEAETYTGDAGHMYDDRGIAWREMKEIIF